MSWKEDGRQEKTEMKRIVESDILGGEVEEETEQANIVKKLQQKQKV